MPVGFFIVRALTAYVLGVSAAAAIASLGGGSTMLLTLYSLIAGLPFLGVALVAGIILRQFVGSHLILAATSVPVVTGFAWWGLGLSLGDLFNAERVALYAVLCSTLSAGCFCLAVLYWPLPSSRKI